MKEKSKKSITILMADDDQDDCMLVDRAFDASRLANDLRFVGDGEELMDYLHQRGAYGDPLPLRYPASSSSTSTCPVRTGGRPSKRSRATRS